MGWYEFFWPKLLDYLFVFSQTKIFRPLCYLVHQSWAHCLCSRRHQDRQGLPTGQTISSLPALVTCPAQPSLLPSMVPLHSLPVTQQTLEIPDQSKISSTVMWECPMINAETSYSFILVVSYLPHLLWAISLPRGILLHPLQCHTTEKSECLAAVLTLKVLESRVKPAVGTNWYISINSFGPMPLLWISSGYLVGKFFRWVVFLILRHGKIVQP